MLCVRLLYSIGTSLFVNIIVVDCVLMSTDLLSVGRGI